MRRQKLTGIDVGQHLLTGCGGGGHATDVAASPGFPDRDQQTG
jgi:hypothetical protein